MILVFGKTGQVSTELQKIGNVLALGRDQADLSNPQSCADTIRSYSPKAVINAAAYTSVDMAEEEEEVATVINGAAPKAMAEACSDLGIIFIHISTDYVFNGSGNLSWKTDDQTGPQNAYGRGKLVGEEGIRNSGAIYAILRTSWVVSAHGSNFIKTMLRLANTKDTLSIVSDQIGGPTPARDIAVTCLKIVDELERDHTKSNTYHYSGAPDVSWADFASEIFALVGKNINIIPLATSNYPTLASRPLNSRMDCSTTKEVFGIIQPDWRNGLKEILEDLEVIT